MCDYSPDGPQPVFQEAYELLQKGVVKVDHFENIYRLPVVFNGAPNWRRATGYNVIGSGQPTIEGLKAAIDFYAKEMGLKKLICVNMRSEPVIYANDFSCAPRNPNNLNENIEISGLSVRDVESLQEIVVSFVREQTKTAGNKFLYHKDTYALVPEDRKDFTCTEECEPRNVRSVKEAYESLQKTVPIELKFLRLPVNDERVPNLEDFDKLVNYLKNDIDVSTGAHFNCQMGKGRTTTGMVLACLIGAKILGQPINPNPSDEKQRNAPGTLEDGNYEIIIALLTHLGVRGGSRMKMEMDNVIDTCGHLQNLRRCIWETKVEYEKEMGHADAEVGKRRAAFWKKLSVNFIERYFYLIIFNVYCTEQTEDKKGFLESFVDWCGRQGKMISILGTREHGPLSTFNWA